MRHAALRSFQPNSPTDNQEMKQNEAFGMRTLVHDPFDLGDELSEVIDIRSPVLLEESVYPDYHHTSGSSSSPYSGMSMWKRSCEYIGAPDFMQTSSGIESLQLSFVPARSSQGDVGPRVHFAQ